MTPEQALATIASERLHLEPRLFGWFAYRHDGDSPEGRGETPLAAVVDWAEKLAKQPRSDWFYLNDRRCFEVVPTTPQPRRRVTLDDLGLGSTSLEDLGL